MYLHMHRRVIGSSPLRLPGNLTPCTLKRVDVAQGSAKLTRMLDVEQFCYFRTGRYPAKRAAGALLSIVFLAWG